MADFGAEQVVQGGAQCFVDDGGFLEVVVGEEVDLVEEVADVDAAQRVHLREGEYARESEFRDGFVRCVPADRNDLIVFLGAGDGHRHVVICGDDFHEVVAEALLEELRVLREEGEEEVAHGGDRVADFLGEG